MVTTMKTSAQNLSLSELHSLSQQVYKHHKTLGTTAWIRSHQYPVLNGMFYAALASYFPLTTTTILRSWPSRVVVALWREEGLYQRL